METIPVYDKNPNLGNKVIFKSDLLYLEFEDAASIEEGEKVTMMKWGNFLIHKKTELEDKIALEGEYLPEDKDFKSTKKLCWLDAKSPLTDVSLIELDHILIPKKWDQEDPNQKFEDVINKNTRFETPALAEAHVKTLSET